MWYRDWNKILEVTIEGVRTRQVSELFQSRNLLCYTRERVKREEREILQSTTTSLYIQLMNRHRTIPHVSMYHPDIQPWSYTTPILFLIKKSTPHHPLSQHLKPCPYHNTLYHPHYTPISASPNISVFRWHHFLTEPIPLYISQHHSPAAPWQFLPSLICISLLLWITAQYKWYRHGFLPPMEISQVEVEFPCMPDLLSGCPEQY